MISFLGLCSSDPNFISKYSAFVTLSLTLVSAKSRVEFPEISYLLSKVCKECFLLIVSFFLSELLMAAGNILLFQKEVLG